MKFYFLLIATLFCLTACDKTNQTVDNVKHFANNLIGQAPPKISDITIQYPTVSPKELNLTAQNLPAPPQKVEQILYFDANGQHTQSPSSGGFYRQILGKTNNGRTMIQDFYQDTQLPQTTILVLKNGGNVQQFDTSVLDGRNIWFNQKGELHAIADYIDGVMQGAQVFYQNKKRVGAFMAQKMLVFHDDGSILALVENDANQPNIVQTTLFRQDGSALVQSKMDGDKVLSASAWQADGSPIRKQADLDVAKQESLPLSQRADAILRLMHE